MTAMLDGVLVSLNDAAKVPEIHGDYSVLHFCISDGDNNLNNHLEAALKKKLGSLPDNWTAAFLGPDAGSIADAKRYGYSAGNAQIWSTDSAGVQEVGRVIQSVTNTFMQNRSVGVRSTTNLFQVDATKISKKTVTKLLDPLKASEYTILQVRKDMPIKDFVESWKIPYVQGMAYYQLSKKEIIQKSKNICIQDAKNGKVYTGDNARQMLGLPDYDVKVSSLDHPAFKLYVQSTSTNRKLIAGTDLLVMK